MVKCIYSYMIRLGLLFFLMGCHVHESQTKKTESKKKNRLASEKSPYLLQHAQNPVDWFPWGEEALDRAKKEDKPIFLSIGYSTCHWCHVMETESFENEEIAKILNENFIAIKVDREERPDVDSIYMSAVQAMIGHGGWPLSVFLTPDGKPFVGATYIPPKEFKNILEKIAQVWKEDRKRVEKHAADILDHLKAATTIKKGELKLDLELLKSVTEKFSGYYEPLHGGFSHAPKFPRSFVLSFLFREYVRTKDDSILAMCEKTLKNMASGGMYDQLGGGFHRYSTDERWLIPHFEKMLYDNALLAKTYTEAYQITKNDFYKKIATETLDYVLRDMTSPEGGFYSAEDADSERLEGKFYVWDRAEIKKILGDEEGDIFCKFFGVVEGGNFEHGKSALWTRLSLDEFCKENKLEQEKVQKILKTGKEKLFNERKSRVRPHRDDKILTSWNGLMISAFAHGYQVYKDKRYLSAATKSADFILKKLTNNGKLLRTYRDGIAKQEGFLDDYAFLALGLIDLYEASFEIGYLEQAKDLSNKMVQFFYDKEQGSFYNTSADHEKLVLRLKEFEDWAIPSGNSVAALVLFKMAEFTMDTSLRDKALEVFLNPAGEIGKIPTAYPFLMIALDFYLSKPFEIIISAPDKNSALEFASPVHQSFFSNRVIGYADKNSNFSSLFKDKPIVDNKTTVYVCQNNTCQKPINKQDDFLSLIGLK